MAICLDLIGISFGSRSVGTERDPKEFRTSSEGDPKECKRKPLGKALEIGVRLLEFIYNDTANFFLVYRDRNGIV